MRNGELDDKQRLQIVEALKESLKIIEYCLHTNKDSGELSIVCTSPCFGYPAVILLFSIIDTIGSFFRETSQKIDVDSEEKEINSDLQHFYILNHDPLFDMKLNESTIKDLYSTYRCKLIHNHALPANNFLINDPDKSFIFKINSDYNVIAVNLAQLYIKVDNAFKTFEYYLKYANWSDEHWLSGELFNKAKQSEDIDGYTAGSGIPY